MCACASISGTQCKHVMPVCVNMCVCFCVCVCVCVCVCININTHIHTHAHTHIYIYIYREKERERVPATYHRVCGAHTSCLRVFVYICQVCVCVPAPHHRVHDAHTSCLCRDWSSHASRTRMMPSRQTYTARRRSHDGATAGTVLERGMLSQPQVDARPPFSHCAASTAAGSSWPARGRSLL